MIKKPIDSIIIAFQSGNREAFGELVRRYQNLVTSIAYANTGDLQRSEDIAQQTFLVAWQKQNEVVEPGRFVAWLRGIAVNVARNDNRLLENVRQKSAVPVENGHADSSENPSTETSRREQSELLWATLDKIPIEYREPLVLYYRSDKSVAEVAEQMELSQSAVKQRLKRGRAMVKQEIELMVDSFLSETKPSGNFTSIVLAALPAVGAKVGLTAAKTGAALKTGVVIGGGKAATGKAATVAAASTLSFAGILAVAASVFAFLVGLGVAWVQAEKTVGRSTSDAEKQVHRNSFSKTTTVSVVFSLVVVFSSLSGSQYIGLMLGIVIPVFVHWMTMHPMKKELKLRRLYQLHGVPDHLKGKPQSRLFPKLASHSTGGLIGGLIGAWGWLLLLLLMGIWFHWSSFFFLVTGIGILVWLIVVASKASEKSMTFAEEFRLQGEFIWKAMLVEAGFCAVLYLVLAWQRTGFLLPELFRVELDWTKITTTLQTSPAMLWMLFLVCPFLVLFGAYMRWMCFEKAKIAEEEAAIGWDLGDGKIVFAHPSDEKN